MNRPRSYTLAAVLMVLYCLIGVLFELPNLARGAVGAAPAGEGPPFALTVINFTIAVLGFVSAYGVWRVQKWGVVLTVVLCVLAILTGLPAIAFAPQLALRLIGGLGIAWSAAIIVLLLRPRPGSVAA